MNREKIIKRLKDGLPKARYNHTLGVEETARELAAIHGEDIELAANAGLLHDYAKCLTYERMLDIVKKNIASLDPLELSCSALLHAPVGAYLAKEECGLTDPRALDAIRYHTTGRAHMTKLEAIIYLADYIEPTREGISHIEDMRRAALCSGLDDALYIAINESVRHVRSRQKALHTRSLEAQNWINLLIKGTESC